LNTSLSHKIHGLSYRPCVACYHRLNGSSSPVLMATSLSYGESKNLPPQNQNPWPDWDKIWHGWLRWGGDLSRKSLCKFLQRGLLGKWVKYTQKFFFIYTFFSTHPQVRPLKGLLCLIRQTTRFCTKRWYYSAAHWHAVSVVQTISPFVIFAVFDVRVLQCFR